MQYSTVHVYRAGYISPKTDGDADAHANTDQAGHCQEQPNLDIVHCISNGKTSNGFDPNK